MDWFRSYHGAPADTKLALVARASGTHRAFVTAVWWELLDHASRNVTQGHASDTRRGDVSRADPEIIAIQQGMEPEEVRCVIQAMVDRGMIVGGRIANWDKYQVRREDPQAAERKQNQRSRAKGKPPQEVVPSRDVTQSHAPEKKRGEKKEKGAAAPLPDWVPRPEWEAFKRTRIKGGVKMTPEAEALNLASLARLRGQGHDPKAVLEQTIANGWKGLFPIKPQDTNQQPTPKQAGMKTL